MQDNYYAVIMAGGGGTRLWPLSRAAQPKQMLQLIAALRQVVRTFSGLRKVRLQGRSALLCVWMLELPGFWLVTANGGT